MSVPGASVDVCAMRVREIAHRFQVVLKAVVHRDERHLDQLRLPVDASTSTCAARLAGANLPLAWDMQHAFLAVLAISGVTRQLFAQSNDSSAIQPAHPVFSMGQPRQWLPLASTFAVVGGGASGGVGALLGVQRSVLNPITGLLSVSGEALGEWRRNESTA